tara:strand:- start:203 stop:934 length:732 start_codon:yes stop_codon:yes gene_type:complete
MNSMDKSLTVIVPFFNEEKTLKKSVDNLISEKVAKSIILVDDKSTDNSLNIAEEFVSKNSNILLLKKGLNEGKGSSVYYAKSHINTSHVIVHDADLEYYPSDIAKLFEISKNNPRSLIVGTRTQKGVDRKKIYKTLVIINKLLTYLFNILNFCNVSDIATCYMLMPTDFFKNNVGTEKRFCIEVEILSQFNKTGGSIIEMPIKYTGRKYSEGKKISISDGLEILIKIFQYSKFIEIFKLPRKS